MKSNVTFLRNLGSFFGLFWQEFNLSVVLSAAISGAVTYMFKSESNLLVVSCIVMFTLITANTVVLRKKNNFDWKIVITPLDQIPILHRYVFYWSIIGLIFIVTGSCVKFFKPSSINVAIIILQFSNYAVLLMFLIRNTALSFLHTASKCRLDWNVFALFVICIELLYIVTGGVLEFFHCGAPTNDILLGMTGGPATEAAQSVKIAVLTVAAGKTVEGFFRLGEEMRQTSTQKKVDEAVKEISEKAEARVKEAEQQTLQARLEAENARLELEIQRRRHLDEIAAFKRDSSQQTPSPLLKEDVLEESDEVSADRMRMDSIKQFRNEAGLSANQETAPGENEEEEDESCDGEDSSFPRR